MTFVNFISAIIWPLVFVGVFMTFRRELKALIEKFSSADQLKFSVGSLSLQAKAMREIHDSIGVNFPDGQLNTSELKALIDTKIRGLQASMEHQVSKGEIRTDQRTVTSKQITVTTDDGQKYPGETLDLSEAGIGFKTSGRLRFHETVKIEANDGAADLPQLNEAVIVRIEQSDRGYCYGAKVAA